MDRPVSHETVSRRRFLAAGVAATTLATAGCLAEQGGAPDGAVANATIPDDPGAFDYAMMGTGEEPVATYYGNWKCPHCSRFSTSIMGGYVTDYVEPGSLSIRYRGMAFTQNGQPFLGPDAETATRAGLAVWHAEPESYWAFHEYVFDNQPPEGREWATADQLVEFAESAGVENTGAIRTAIDEGQYQELIDATTRDSTEDGVQGTPTMVLDGQAFSPLQEQQTRDYIESVIG